MEKTQISHDTLRSIVDIARLAPSVHNTQPWSVTVEGSDVVISIDSTYALEDGDPTGRQTIISLGIFAEAVCLASRHQGFAVVDVIVKDKTARVSLAAQDEAAQSTEAAELLARRCSDRSIYKPAEITPAMIKTLESVEPEKGVSVTIVTDRPILETIATLTSKGIRLALSSPSFRKELSQYLTLPWSAKKRGIAVKSLYIPTLLELLQPVLIREGIGLDKEAEIERERWLSASAVIIVTADGDMPDYWFKVGRIYLRLSLAVEKMGLSQATSASIVEASNYHEDIEELLGTTYRIQAMIRIGQGSSKRYHSPRVSTDELIEPASR